MGWNQIEPKPAARAQNQPTPAGGNIMQVASRAGIIMPMDGFQSLETSFWDVMGTSALR